MSYLYVCGPVLQRNPDTLPQKSSVSKRKETPTPLTPVSGSGSHEVSGPSPADGTWNERIPVEGTLRRETGNGHK